MAKTLRNLPSINARQQSSSLVEVKSSKKLVTKARIWALFGHNNWTAECAGRGMPPLPGISKAKMRRRNVGSDRQNNLKVFHCAIDFALNRVIICPGIKRSLKFRVEFYRFGVVGNCVVIIALCMA
jgi:hypothetical protein